MKNQALFSSKDKRKKLKCRLLQFLFGTLRVNTKARFYIPLKHRLPFNYQIFNFTIMQHLSLINA